jgi:hypothetical protein
MCGRRLASSRPCSRSRASARALRSPRARRPTPSLRPYEEPWPLEDALAELHSGRSAHFDPVVVDAFLAMVDELDPLLPAPHEALRVKDRRGAAA